MPALPMRSALPLLGYDGALPRCSMKETPLFYAVRMGQVDVVKQLLEAGADMLLKSTSGDSALDLAGASKVPGMFQCMKGAYSPLVVHERG